MNKLTIVTLALGSAALTACGAFGTKAKEVKHETVTRSELVGKWKAACVPSRLYQGLYTKMSYDFAVATGYTFNEQIFDDNACAKLNRTLKLTGDYSFPQSFQPGSNPIDFKVNEAALTAERDDVAKQLVDSKYCGKTDWQKGFAKSVLKADCPDMQQLDKGKTISEIFEIRDGKLYLNQPFLAAAPLQGHPSNSLDLGIPFSE